MRTTVLRTQLPPRRVAVVLSPYSEGVRLEVGDTRIELVTSQALALCNAITDHLEAEGKI